jgi:3-oxoadipate CoA-transferase beta subunit
MTMATQSAPRTSSPQRVARDIHDGAYVNLGIGMPTLVANHLPAGREVILQSENGILGMGPAPAAGEEDYDLINAGKQPVTLLPGRRLLPPCRQLRHDARRPPRHLRAGRLPGVGHRRPRQLEHRRAGAIPAVGGAMDLAIGAKQTWVMMDLLTKKGESKLVERCTYPLTGIGCVKRVYTDIWPPRMHARRA